MKRNFAESGPDGPRRNAKKSERSRRGAGCGGGISGASDRGTRNGAFEKGASPAGKFLGLAESARGKETRCRRKETAGRSKAVADEKDDGANKRRVEDEGRLFGAEGDEARRGRASAFPGHGRAARAESVSGRRLLRRTFPARGRFCPARRRQARCRCRARWSPPGSGVSSFRRPQRRSRRR